MWLFHLKKYAHVENMFSKRYMWEIENLYAHVGASIPGLSVPLDVRRRTQCEGDEDPALPGCSHWEDRQVEEVGRLQREQEQRVAPREGQDTTPRRKEGVQMRRRRVGEEVPSPDWMT